jgi:hypothetical protein
MNYSYLLIVAFVILLIIICIWLYFRNIVCSKYSGPLPKEIILIRHGEKPKTGGNLNSTGYTHANCWADFFINNRPTSIDQPQVLYAMKQKDKKNSSNRPYETIYPLSQKLNLNINNNYFRDDEVLLIKDILSSKNINKTVLVCWEHDAIPNIFNELVKQVYNKNSCKAGVKSWGINPTNNKNEGGDFSTIWKVTFDNDIINLETYPGCDVKNDGTCDFNPKKNINSINTYSCKNSFN